MTIQKRTLYILVGVILAVTFIWLWRISAWPGAGGDQGTSGLTGFNQPTRKAIELVSPSGFVNTDGIRLSDLIGKKVILVDFWTYSCINCQRTLPYLNAWYDKYKEDGFEIIGVHSPEFDFEKKIENVRDAVTRYGIKYPVALDNDFGTWNAYGNQYWPRKYLIDIHGNIVYDHIGEGGYDETEKKIQALLSERATVLNMQMPTLEGLVQPSNAVTKMLASRSPETYFGAARNDHFGNGDAGVVGVQTLKRPTKVMADDSFYLVGSWDFQPEYAQSTTSAQLLFRYRAMNVYFVASADQPINVRVLRDGVLVTNDLAGADVHDGIVTIQGERLYHLISEQEGSEHTLELQFDKPGLKAFTFTFG